MENLDYEIFQFQCNMTLKGTWLAVYSVWATLFFFRDTVYFKMIYKQISHLGLYMCNFEAMQGSSVRHIVFLYCLDWWNQSILTQHICRLYRRGWVPFLATSFKLLYYNSLMIHSTFTIPQLEEGLKCPVSVLCGI